MQTIEPIKTHTKRRVLLWLLAGVVLLKEPFSPWQVLGVVLILACVFAANVSGKKE